jgi:hypothetical protein
VKQFAAALLPKLQELKQHVTAMTGGGSDDAQTAGSKEQSCYDRQNQTSGSSSSSGADRSTSSSGQGSRENGSGTTSGGHDGRRLVRHRQQQRFRQPVSTSGTT